MQLVLLAALAASAAYAATVTADRITIDVGIPELINHVSGPGAPVWRIPVIVSARLSNTAAEDVYLRGVGGASGVFPPSQIWPDGVIEAEASVEGPMFAADIASRLADGANLTDERIIDAMSGSRYAIYAADGTQIENDWLIPPIGQPDRPPVTVRRSTGVPVLDDPGGAVPEPGTFALVAIGIGSASFVAARRRRA